MKKKLIALSLMTVAGVAFIDTDETLPSAEQEVIMHQEEEQENDY